MKQIPERLLQPWLSDAHRKQADFVCPGDITIQMYPNESPKMTRQLELLQKQREHLLKVKISKESTIGTTSRKKAK